LVPGKKTQVIEDFQSLVSQLLEQDAEVAQIQEF
jgi:hypothetical protein